MILKLENGLDVYLGSIQPPGVTKTDKGMNFAVAFDKREPFILKIWADGQCFEIPMYDFHVVGDMVCSLHKKFKGTLF